MLDAMLKDVRKANPARIIAIGGGSVMDCAKLFVFDGDDCAEEICFYKNVNIKKQGNLSQSLQLRFCLGFRSQPNFNM